MAALLDSLSSSLTPEMLGALSSSLGMDPKLVSQGINVVGPLFLSGAAEAAATPGGADMLGGLLSQLPDFMGSDPVSSLASLRGGGLVGLLGGLVGMLEGASAGAMPDVAGSPTSGSAVGSSLSGLIKSGFGSGIGAIGKSLKKSLGFDVTPLLMLVLPMILGMLKKAANDQNLDNAGVARMLQTESHDFLNSGSPQAKLVQGALDVGMQARALRGNFSDAEWAAVRSAPLAVASLVTTASGSGGTAAELATAANSVKSMSDAADAVSVMGMCFEQGYAKDDLATVTNGMPKEASLASIASAIRLVAAKSPSEVDGFKKMLLQVGHDVAGATKQGGFLGLGGKKITDAEAAALRDLEEAVKNA